MRKRKDSLGRIWNYCDSEGSYQLGKHIIGCGAKNGSKWQIWNGPNASHWEYDTLKEAMEDCSNEE